MKRYDKFYKNAGELIAGIVFIFISIILFWGKDKLYKDIINIVVLVFLLISLYRLFRFFYKSRTVKEQTQSFISCILNLLISLVFMYVPNLSYSFLPILFSIYLFFIGSSQFIMYFLMVENKEKHRFNSFFGGIIYYSISIPILYAPINNLDTFISCLSIYLLLLGITSVYDYIKVVMPIKVKNKLKRSIRITLPKILEAIIPYTVMTSINDSLDTYNYNVLPVDFKNKKANLYVLIHTSCRGFNKMGHIDIYFDGNVISYGNYDEGSRKFKELFGDGVIFKTNKKKNYINFCIKNSGKTIFVYGIVLSDIQRDAVRKRIADLFFYTVRWNYKDDKKYNKGNSYASKLYKSTRAKFYKFKSGKYKTYFITGTNCCYLADDIIGKSGIDLLSLNGIITPGTYYDYLEKELHRKSSFVVFKKIYNSNNKYK